MRWFFYAQNEVVSIKRQWYICPYCGKKVLQYNDYSKGERLFIKCKNCKKEIEINLKN